MPNYNYNVSNELTSNSTGSYTYDANGNTLTDASGKSYSWDFENRMTQAVVPGSGTATFKYDPFGRRIEKSSWLGTTNYLYDRVSILETTDQNGNELARYADTLILDEPLSELVSGTASFYEQDGLGSATSLSSSAGALANTYVYDSFGKPTASTGAVANQLQYTAHELDSETGDYYYRARYYDDTTGRFISEDPLGFAGGDVDLYGFVSDNPTNLSDPFGLSAGCGCSSPPAIPAHPADADVDKNIAAPEDWPFSQEAIFIEMVQTGGPWDYKQQSENNTDYTDFGNFNFGAVCEALGHSLYYCQSGAGAAHLGRYIWRKATGHHPVYGGQGFPFLKYPYGDQSADSGMIALGYAYAQWRKSCQ